MSLPPLNQIRAVNQRSFKAHLMQACQRLWNILGAMRRYVLEENGLAFYVLHEEPDALKCASMAGRLLVNEAFLFPNPQVP